MPQHNTSPRLHFWLDFAVFQVGWFACVLGAANRHAWIALVAAALALAVHSVWTKPAGRELELIACVTMLGTLLDSAVLNTGWIRYASGMYADHLAPYWITALWMLFATTLNVSMRWLHGHYGWAVLLGAIGGPLSYWGAARLNAVQFVDTMPLLITLAVVWAMAMPVCIWLAARLDAAAYNAKAIA